ncbi:conserved hypothetical protein [Vibrio chagasii]|nr:conserved hypothetical protein [Vibrio chagasii]
MPLKLVTSNEFKIKEFKRFGLDVEITKGADLPEVLGTPLEVVTYKALDAGVDCMVEDTILTINGKEVVDIKARIDELTNLSDASAVWTTSVAVNTGTKVITAYACTVGKIGIPAIPTVGSFGFDAYFYPDNANDLSLHQLELNGTKDDFSARKRCIEVFMTGSEGYKETALSDIPKWTGEYQNV